MRVVPVLSVSLAALISASVPAFAEERYLNFALRGGVGTAPDYPGSDSYSPLPDLGLQFGALKWGKLKIGNGIGHVPENGLSFAGAFKVIGTREAADNPELAGLNDLDAALELGLTATYRETNWLAFGQVRKGVVGHSGVTGTLGADLIFRPDDRWTVSMGPRVNFGDSDYASTYFGVTGAEAARSGYGAYNATGGALGAGFAVQANYQINDNWAAYGMVGYEKLLGDAADSPITMGGSDDQWSMVFGLSRAFTIRF